VTRGAQTRWGMIGRGMIRRGMIRRGMIRRGMTHGARTEARLGWRRRTAAETIQRVIGGRRKGFVIHKLLNIRGNYAVISI
jgi:hypothetical protein